MAPAIIPSRDTILKTPRLRLRPTEPSDARRLFEIQSNWNVTRMLRLANWPAELATMQVWVSGHAEEWRSGEAFRFAVIHQERVVGCADVDDFTGDGGEIGYWLDEAVWGQGLAREAARALVDFAFRELNLGWLHAGRAAANPASGRVLEHLGFIQVAKDVRYSRPLRRDVPYVFYRLTRP